jgi:hypothetical protein
MREYNRVGRVDMGRSFLQLDMEPEVRIPRFRAFLDFLRSRRRLRLDGFGAFIGLSVLCHLALVGFLVVRGGPPDQSAADALRSNIGAFSRAILERDRAFAEVSSGLDSVERDDFAGQAEVLSSLLLFDKTVSERDKVDFFRSLLEAAGATPDKSAGVSPTSGSSPVLSKLLDQRVKLDSASGGAFFVTRNPVNDTYEVDDLDRGTLEKIEQLDRPGPPDKESQPGGSTITVAGIYGPTSVPPEYFFRKSPYAAIAAKGPRLFTVFRGFPAEGSQPSPRPGTDTLPFRAPDPKPPAGFIFVVTRRSIQEAAGRKAVLRLSPEKRSEVLDELMALHEPEQLETFKVRYLDAFDPDQGDLAALTREFFYSNLNGVFIMTSPVASTFDIIEGIYFKRAVYDFFAAYGRRLSKTRTGVELYLDLASTYDFERRALSALRECREDVRRVLAAAEERSDGYQLRLKAFVLHRLYREVVDLARSWGISFEDLSGLYLRRQEEVYRLVSERGGETRNRALWAWGRLRWELGDVKGAVDIWKRADMSFTLPSMAFRRIRETIDRYDFTKIIESANFSHDVNEYLSAENAQDRQILLERHLKYKTWAKRLERP